MVEKIKMKVSGYNPIIQPTVPPMPTKSFDKEIKEIAARINRPCKYMLPCGWCEKRDMRCEYDKE